MIDTTDSSSQPVYAIDLQRVSLNHRGKQILHHLTLQVPSGVIAGLVGPNGAGKTTTFRLIGGLIGSFSGTAQVLGNQLPDQAETARRQLGIVPEHDGILEDMRVRDVLMHAARLQRPGERLWQVERVEEVLRELGIWDRQDDWCGTLSMGLRRRIAIGRAILHTPPLLLLDEVTNGLDIVSRNGFYEWLMAHHLESANSTIVLATHNTAEVARLCNYFIVLRDGQQCFCGPREALIEGDVDMHTLEAAFLQLLQALEGEH